MAFDSRIILIVPQAQCATINTWIRNNLDSVGADWLRPNLSASGNNPATHAWCCAALTVPQLKQIINRLCTVASVTLPADWDTRTRAQKRNFIKTSLGTALQGMGWRVTEADNDGAWDDANAFLTAANLKVINIL